MTKLSKRKSRLIFETSDEIREQRKYRSVVIEATGYMAFVKLKGTRTAFPVSWASIYHLAAKQAVVRALADKKAGKNAR